MFCRAAWLAAVAVVVLVAVVVVTQMTTKGSEPQTVGLPFASPGRWHLCFKVSILHFVSLRENGERGKSGDEIH